MTNGCEKSRLHGLFFIISGYFLKSDKLFATYVKEKFIRLSQPYAYICVQRIDYIGKRI